MTDTLNEYNPPAPVRPVFLTVLCILTFIGSGLGICSSAIEYFTADRQAAKSEIVKSQIDSSVQQIDTLSRGGEIAAQMMKSVEHVYTAETMRKSALAKLLSCIFCLLGAFLIWGLKKSGFYLYILGTLIGIIVPYILLGGGLLAIGSSAIIALIGIAFVIMYGVNLKHMQ